MPEKHQFGGAVVLSTPTDTEPTGLSVGAVYLDDGTNTSSGDPEWRRLTSTGPDVWEDMGGGGGGGAGSYVTGALAWSYVEAATPVEETMGEFNFDGSLVTTADLVVVLTPNLTTGNCSVKLYDLGPVGSPTAPRTVSTLTTSVATGLQVLSQTLTSVAATPGTNQILQADHTYRLVVTSAAQVGDTVYVGNARIEA